MSTFRRTTTTTTSSFGRPRTVTTTTTTSHNPTVTVNGDVLFALLLAEMTVNIVKSLSANKPRIHTLSFSQREKLAIEVRKHARNCQNCALGSKDGKRGPRSAQNQTDMIETALERAEYANLLDFKVVPDAHVRALRELARNVAHANEPRTTPSMLFKHTAIG